MINALVFAFYSPGIAFTVRKLFIQSIAALKLNRINVWRTGTSQPFTDTDAGKPQVQTLLMFLYPSECFTILCLYSVV